MVLTTPYGTRLITMVLTRVPRQRVITLVITLVFPGRQALQLPTHSNPGNNSRAIIPAQHAIATNGLGLLAAAAPTSWACPPSLLGFYRQLVTTPSAQRAIPSLNTHGITSMRCGSRELVADQENTHPGEPPTTCRAKQLGEAADCGSRDQSEEWRDERLRGARQRCREANARRGW